MKNWTNLPEGVIRRILGFLDLDDTIAATQAIPQWIGLFPKHIALTINTPKYLPILRRRMAELPSVEVNLNGVGPTLPGGAFGLLFSNEVTGQFNNLVSLDLSGQCQSTGDILRVFQNLPFSALRSLSLRPAVTLEDKSQRILPLEGAVNAPPKLREFHLHFYGIGLEHSWEAA